MEISLFQQDEPLRFERIILYPYPDLKRIWTRVWLNAAQGEKPNIELTVFNPDGSENASVFMLAHAEQRAETTLHLRSPVPHAVYHVVAQLSLGISEQPKPLDRREFDLTLEFRNPETAEPGFGFGVDWAELQRKKQGAPS